MKRLIVTFFVVFLASGFFMRGAEGENEWTRFRGPNGSGISGAQTIPIKWTAKEYNWTMKLPGDGSSSPVVWQDKLFVTCNDPNNPFVRSYV